MKLPGWDPGCKYLKIAVDRLGLTHPPALYSTGMPSTLDLTLGAAETGVSIGTLYVRIATDIFSHVSNDRPQLARDCHYASVPILSEIRGYIDSSGYRKQPSLS
jgi:hypothetical protein